VFRRTGSFTGTDKARAQVTGIAALTTIGADRSDRAAAAPIAERRPPALPLALMSISR
jgi:hypothetical protein